VDGQKETKEVVVKDAVSVCILEVTQQPDLVNVDGDKMLLCEKVERHTPEEIAYMFYDAPKFMDRYEALKALASSKETFATQTIIDGLSDQFPQIRRTAIRSLEQAVKNDPAGVKTKLMDLGKNARHTRVKGDALYSLS